MSYFTTRQHVIEIDDNIVTVRALTYGEEQVIEQKCMRVSAQFDGQGEAVIDASLMQQMILRKRIVDWDGPGFSDEDGKKIPVSPANIDRLPGTVIQRIVAGLNEQDEGLTEAEKKA